MMESGDEQGKEHPEVEGGDQESLNDSGEGKKDVKTDSEKISEWIINAPDKVRIIGCGEYGANIVDSIYINYAEKLSGIKNRNFNKPTKPDYLDLKLVPDYRNIRSAGIKKEVEEDLESRHRHKYGPKSDPVKKVTLISRIKSVFGQKQESAKNSDRDNTGKGSELEDKVFVPATEPSDLTAGEQEGVIEPDEQDAPDTFEVETPGGYRDPRDIIVKKARAELESELKEFLPDTDLLFIVTDLASPYGMDNSLTAAKIARALDTITVGIVILPTKLDKLDEVEYGNRSLQAFRLIADIIVVVPDIEHVIEGYLVLMISELMELMTTSGLINLDVADVKTVVGGGNVAMIGFGAGFKKDGNKIMDAIKEAVSSPILNVDLNGVNRTLVNVTGDTEMTISEAQKAAKMILDKIQPDARLIWGAAINPKLKGAIKVMVMAGVKPKNILVHIYANS